MTRWLIAAVVLTGLATPSFAYTPKWVRIEADNGAAYAIDLSTVGYVPTYMPGKPQHKHLSRHRGGMITPFSQWYVRWIMTIAM